MIKAGDKLTLVDVYNATAKVEDKIGEEGEFSLFIHPNDFSDIEEWEVDVTGWDFQRRIKEGEKVIAFASYYIIQTEEIDEGTILIMHGNKIESIKKNTNE